MQPHIISIAPSRTSPETMDRLRSWADTTPGVEHIVLRPRGDGGLDAVVYVQSTVSDLAAQVDREVLGGDAPVA